MSLEITFSGPLTTVQDLGRTGYRKDAFGVSGVMDRRAAITANRLVGNADGCAVLEMTLIGIQATLTEDAVLCLSGAEMPFTVQGESVPSNTPVVAKAGDKIAIGVAKSGCRGYLAVRGGLDVPVVMGSRSTNLKCGIGGFQGRKLAVGDRLSVLPSAPFQGKIKSFPTERYYSKAVVIRAVAGPQRDWFDDEQSEKFFSAIYTVSAQSDRMGIRLNGAPVQAQGGVDILSDGTVAGSVQIPKDGQPIVLLADCQTTGGYAKIATVISADLPTLGQLRAGDKLRFVRCTVREGQKIRRKQERRLPKPPKR